MDEALLMRLEACNPLLDLLALRTYPSVERRGHCAFGHAACQRAWVYGF
jgi:hypothetical protein